MMVLYRCAVWGGGAKTRIAQMLSAVLPALTVKADILDRQPGAVADSTTSFGCFAAATECRWACPPLGIA